MIIGNDNKPVAEEIIEDCEAHISENMPIGCKLTVITPSLLNVVIKANIELKDGYELEDVKLEFKNSLNEYLKDVTNELTYSKIYGLLVNLPGIGDINNLLVNDGNSNITISEDKIVNISEINLSEVV
jgi:uncharacterized phage protein gp47/JayE